MREDLAARRLDQLAHVLFSLFEAAPGDAGYHLVPGSLLLGAAAHAERVKVLNARHLVSGRAVVSASFVSITQNHIKS